MEGGCSTVGVWPQVVGGVGKMVKISIILVRKYVLYKGFPDSSVGQESTHNAGDPGLIPRVRKIPWRRDRLPIPEFLGFPCGSAG